MESATTIFNPIQLYLLRMFERNKTEEELLEVKQVLADYYSKKLDERFDELWESGVLDQKRLDEINEMDLHVYMRGKQ